MVSSASRPLTLRVRPDVTSVRQSYQGRDYWVVKDPVAMKYFRFEEEEHYLLQKFDGTRSPDQIKRQFDYDFAPQKISLQELYQFSGMLYRSSLLLSDAANQGVQLKTRGDAANSRVFKQSITNILALRVRGFDPDKMLGDLIRWTGWFFTWPAFALALMLVISALSLLITQFETFQAKLPAFDEFFASGNWIWLAFVLALTKVVHEFGHGLACKKFGGQCHEMGVMLLVLTPCLYVNVSDSWLLPSKWKRAFIAAAGMYVEQVLASIAVFVWWFSQPGMVNQLALNVIFVSSVSTLLFNANPLLRYDGYYILSDLLEIPNLRSKATAMLQRTSAKLFLGIESRHDPFLPVRRKWIFMTYSIAAVLYRWVITISIFWFVYRVLEPYGLKIIGQLLALSSIYALLVMPLIQLGRYFRVPGRMGTVKTFRAAATCVAAAALLAGVLLIPIPHYVYGLCHIQPANGARVYVEVPGTLVTIHTDANQPVVAGQPLITLQSPELVQELASMETSVTMAKTQYQMVSYSASIDPTQADSLSEAAAAYNTAVANLVSRNKDQHRLVVRAPCAGTLLPAADVPAEKSDSGQLGQWNGTPFEPRNLGAWLPQRTLVGTVVPDMQQMRAVLAIDQADIEFVRPDRDVEIILDQIPCEIFHARTEPMSPTRMTEVPRNLSSRHGGDLVTTVDSDGQDVPQSTTYLVSVALENPRQTIAPGSTGHAKIRAGSQTIAQRLWRLAGRTFQFEL